MTILVTGGAGYIGSHTVVELLEASYDVVIADNYSNSKPEVVHRIEEITSRKATLYPIDIRDKSALQTLFAEHEIESVIHFAALKAVGESVKQPLAYYNNNVAGTLALLEVMQANQVKKLVYSSSATVYGSENVSPLDETMPTSAATNPYGYTKIMTEQILQDLALADPSWSIVILRYFNPIGAHESGLIGEDPTGVPNNIMPYITQVAINKLPKLNIFGADYDTEDGTGVRDYIHVVDLARGHAKAIDKIRTAAGVYIYNLGTGKGYSVLELVNAFQEATGVKINYSMGERRPGDVAEVYANPALAQEELNWRAEKSLIEMCRDSWHWQESNPQGYN